MGLLIIVIVFFILVVGEYLFPLRRRIQPRMGRWVVNCVLSLMTYGSAWAFVRPAVSWARQEAVADFSLAALFSNLPVLQFVLGFLFLDLSFYYWHRLNHEWSFLWRFHKVHHVDLDLDVTTGFRFHFVEVALSAAFRAIQVFIVGGPLQIYVAYELIFQIATFFHHSNIRLPIGIEKMLNVILVTPRMHGFHHSQKMEQTHSNYSVVFSFWDRLHRSFSGAGDQERIQIGVSGYGVEDNKFLSLLIMPVRDKDIT